MDQKLKKAFAKVIPINKCIYECGGSYVFTIKGSPNMVVKINMGYDGSERYGLEVIKYCATRKNPSVVKIHKYGKLKVNEDTYSYYIMDKLKPLSADDENIIMDIICNYYNMGRPAMPTYASRKLQNFIKQANKLKYYYNDLHSGNIMLDKQGNFKFIDLESFDPK